MKNKEVLTVILIAVAAIIMALWGVNSCSKKQITKLQREYAVAEGRRIELEANEMKLNNKVSVLMANEIIIAKRTDSLKKVYESNLNNKNAIINKYKLRDAAISSLSDSVSMEMFNDAVVSNAPVIYATMKNTSGFIVPVDAIQGALYIFSDRDRLYELKQDCEQSLMQLQSVTKSLEDNVDVLTNVNIALEELNSNKDQQLEQSQSQIDNLKTISKKEKRKGNRKLFIGGGIGAALTFLIMSL